MHFDARAAKLLKLGEHLLVSGCPGLRLEVSVSHKTWTYRYKNADGVRLNQVAIGQWPTMPAQAAVAKWQALKEQRENGADPVAVRKAERLAIQERVNPPQVYTVQRPMPRT